jgi:BMFP domain-containing protein YqiC
MSARRKLLNDLSKIANSSAGVLQGAYGEAENMVRQRLEALLDKMDLVTREEFDAVKAMAAAARRENEALEKRLIKLEGKAKPAQRAAGKKPAAKTTAAKKPTVRKPAAKKKVVAKKPTAKKTTKPAAKTSAKPATKRTTKKPA